MYLYHYTKLATLLNCILPSGTLMSNNLANMNDPRESHRWAFGGVNLPLRQLFPDFYSAQTHIECQFKFGDMVKDRFQILCFSGANHGGWNNEMMWAHYADRQAGVCIEFDEEKLLASIQTHYPSMRFESRSVNYEKKSKEKPYIHWDGNLSQEENLKNFLEVAGREVVFNKSHFWEKEDEKRLLFLNYPSRLFIPFEDSLRAVHIGLGIPKSLHEDIFNSLQALDINLYTMVYQHNRYERWHLTKKDMNWCTFKE